MGKATFDGTEANDYITVGAEGLGRLAGVLVSQGVNAETRVVAFDVLGNGIHETKQRSAGGAFGIVQGLVMRRVREANAGAEGALPAKAKKKGKQSEQISAGTKKR